MQLLPLFAAAEKQKIQSLKSLVVKLVKRNVFDKQDLWRLVCLRYGSVASFDRI